MTDPRSRQRLEFHYRIERELAERLKRAAPGERLGLYGKLYDELFRRVSDHPQHTQPAGQAQRARAVREQLTNLEPWLRPDATFLELGAGDGAVSRGAAEKVGRVFALDVSEVIGATGALPANMSRLLSDGIRIDLPSSSVDLAYSHQLIEHLHPEDVDAQLAEVRRVLKVGGVYLCVTPSRLTGPHDVSGFFDETATGFHLREYSIRELVEVFVRAGFNCSSVIGQVKGKRVEVPLRVALQLEGALELMPRRLARQAASRRPLRWLLNTIQVVAVRS